MKILRLFLLSLFLTIAHAAEQPKAWPNVPFKHVVAYCYDFSQDTRGSDITFPDGSLHKGVIRATTVRLTEPQVQQVVGLLTKVSEEEDGEADCYEPHHAFVFYDADWKVVASIDVCFLCEDYIARPKGVSENIDLAALEKFCRGLGLPVFEKPEAYSALFKQEQASVEFQKAPEKVEEKLGKEDAIDPFAKDELLEPAILPVIE